LKKKKRQLIKLIFKELSLNGNNLTFTYTKPFEFLLKAVKETNSLKIKISPQISSEKFEPAKKDLETEDFIPICSV